MNNKIYNHSEPFLLESGAVLQNLRIDYTTFGTVNEECSNVIWVLHALTANSNPSEWWEGLFGESKLLDPEKYFIICANNLGSCYGTTGPVSINAETGIPYGADFPLITIRDMVKAHELLREHLHIDRIHLAIGGSLGGMIALEWNISNPLMIENTVVIATNARHSAWGIAFNEAQRMALRDEVNGLAAARAIAMLSYRSYDSYNATQTDGLDNIDGFKASSYQQYQGQKLMKRFNRHSYFTLSKAMDSHNVGRGRGSIEAALSRITAKTLIIGISSDVLFPVVEQKFLKKHIRNSRCCLIDSTFGHDGFLLEFAKLTKLIKKLIGKPKTKKNHEKHRLNRIGDSGHRIISSHEQGWTKTV
ncbi:MAG: homoserine O-acetyltransferase [Ignavibacteriales bacterium]|nr:homoserine O-acetyltransferase [Ignavibacteriales bacterium]